MPGKTKKYSITQKHIAKYFGYSNAKSFNSSSARDRILKGINMIIIHVENKLSDELKK